MSLQYRKILLVYLIINFSVTLKAQDSTFLKIEPGAYYSFDDAQKNVKIFSSKEVLNGLAKDSNANVLVLSQAEFGKIYCIVFENHIYVNQGQHLDNNSGAAWNAGVAGVFASASRPVYLNFVRLIKWGRICLTISNRLVRVPSKIGYAISIKHFKDLIKDDPALLAEFKKEIDKKVAVYSYIDSYNKRNGLITSSDND